ncbi:hypothetical protein ACP2ZX_28660, partial [Klebsiella pneumoniae subsp. pneumoniae]|uniref:hypothetical protein n=1 Tax=Klebsiella pneumoniae TaxID=573 RepID=UPI003CEEF6E2
RDSESVLIMPGGGWRLTRPTHPALIVCRPAHAQRRRARTAGTELILCRVAAAPYPAYVRTTCR